MRIVGGYFKGRILKQFDLENIRPTADNVRENLFNILGKKVEECVFLDLFCGTGACGIEALSRGAKKVIFNDNSLDSVKLTKENLSKLNADKKLYEISQKNGLIFLQTASEKFDVVYIDPPYKNDFLEQVVNESANIINDDGIIICENEKPFLFDTPCLIKYDERKYGRVYLTFFKKAIPKQETCLFAGSFDPVTNGHIEIVKESLKRYKNVVVAIGHNSEKTPMFSVEQRLELLHLAFNDERITIDAYDGLTVDYMKKNNIKVDVRGIRDAKDKKYEKKLEEFNSAHYLDYKQELIFVGDNFNTISSTIVKKDFLNGKDISKLVPIAVYDRMKEMVKK